MLVLEATVQYPYSPLGVVAYSLAAPNTKLRRDGNPPVRLEIPVTAADLARQNGASWYAFVTIVGTDGFPHSNPGSYSAAYGDLTITLVTADGGGAGTKIPLPGPPGGRPAISPNLKNKPYPHPPGFPPPTPRPSPPRGPNPITPPEPVPPPPPPPGSVAPANPAPSLK